MALKMIAPSVLKEWLDRDEAILIDVREPAEYKAEHIPRAISHPASALNPSTIKLQASGRKIVFHCLSGKRAGSACTQFQDETDLEAMQLDGNLHGWKEAGFTTESNSGFISLDRQILIIAGALSLIGLIMGSFVSPSWLWLSGIVSAGLLLSGITGACMLKKILTKFPFNQQALT